MVMRTDMFKVIVERPRSWKNLRASSRARLIHEEDAASGPMRPRGSYRALNENLRPLERYLHAQTHRPWNNVYSELRAQIDARSTVKQHILEHLEDFVAFRTFLQDGEVWVSDRRWCGDPVPLRYSRHDLFVSPTSGILLPNKFAVIARAERTRKSAAVNNADNRRRILGESEQLIRLDEIWYQVMVGKFGPNSRPLSKAWCAVRNALVSLENDDSFAGEQRLGNRWLFGSPELYAISKRQLGKRELRQHGL
jgi:hypothetical protein